jgi:hypothetical protein
VGEGLESNRSHEFGSRLGHNDINQGPGLYQPTGQLGSLISGNAAGYTHNDMFVLKQWYFGHVIPNPDKPEPK